MAFQSDLELADWPKKAVLVRRALSTDKFEKPTSLTPWTLMNLFSFVFRRHHAVGLNLSGYFRWKKIENFTFFLPGDK